MSRGVLATLGVALAACSLVTSYDGFTGGRPDAGSDAAPGADASDEGAAADGSDAPSGPCGSASLACAPAVPAGWAGPAILYDKVGPPLASPPACPGAYPAPGLDGFAQLSAPAATCTCDCGTPQGGSCGNASVTLYDDPGCQTPCDGPVSVENGTCSQFTTSCPSPVYLAVTAPYATGGTCSPTLSSDVPTAAWSEIGRACSVAPAQPAACAGGGTCVPAPPVPFDGSLCVFSAGEVPCPTGSAYTARHVFYAGVDDSRACGACSACTVTGSKCTGSITPYTGGCSTSVSPVPFGTACQSESLPAGLEGNATFTPGTCGGAVSTPSGGAAGTSPSTVCCAP